jgi:serine/threonine-protein kinase
MEGTVAERHPALDVERWGRVEAIFHAARERSSGREAFLDGECGGDLELRAAVERLLAADGAERALVDRPLEDVALPLLAAEATETPRPVELDAGTQVGRYRLLDLIGRGGMGSVYRAERADGAYERQVAIKLVDTERLGDEGERRFRRERQILARLQHPGIATLLDGGVTDGGRPYLVMELIEGTALTDYAENAGLGVADRLRLVQQVVEAVDFAHRNLVVHRDLKPSNILVTESGAVKLLDFGIARIIEEDPDEGTTRTGVYLLTPEYAAPEQIRGERITTATDVYALGAVLYELLAGRRPLGAVGRGWKDLERVLREDPAPLSRAEGLDPHRRRALEGDLTTIVARAMQKDPGRRYASARSMGEDLQRYLDGRPVAARPDSIRYRVAKFIGRNRVASALGAVVAVTVTAGVVGTVWQSRAAQSEAERAQAVGDFLFSLFDGADPDLHPGEPVTAFELLESGLARVDSLDAGPATRVDLLTRLGILFGKLGHEARSDELLRRAVDASTRYLGPDDPATGTALDALGVHLALVGDLDEAEQVLLRALDVRRTAGTSAVEIGTTQGNLAKAIERAGRYDEAIESYLAAIATLDRATGGDSLRFATELMGLAQTYERSERFAEADTLMRTVRRLREREGDSPTHAIAIHNLGHLTATWKDDLDGAVALHEEALAMWRRIFPDGRHPEISRSLEQIARLRELQGQWTKADSLYDQALGIWSNLYGDEHPHLAAIRANQANLHYRRGDFDRAADAYRDVVRVYRAVGDPQLLAVSIHNLGVIQRERGDYPAADSLLAEALDIRRGYVEEPHSEIAQSLATRAGLYNLQGRHADAEDLARDAIEQYEAVLPPEHSAILWPRLEWGIALAGQGRDAEAQPLLEASHEAFTETLNPQDAAVGRSALWLGIVLARQGDRVRARELIEAARENLEASLRPGAPELVRAERELAALGG